MHPETDPLFSSYILATVADWQELLSKTHVHDVYIPVAILSLAHAVRMSHGTRMLCGGAQGRLGLFQSCVLNLIALFAPSSLLALLLGMPSPLLMSPVAICLYTVVHCIMYTTGLGHQLIRLHTHPAGAFWLEIGLACIDSLCRTEGMANVGLAQIQRHPHPVLAQSWTAQVIAGTLLAAGMPLIASAFQLHSPMGIWQLRTPAWIHEPSRLLYADLVGGATVSLLLLVLTSGNLHAKLPWLPRPTRSMARWLALSHKPDIHRSTHLPYLSAREAKAVCTAVFFVCLLVPIIHRRLVKQRSSVARQQEGARTKKAKE